MQKSGEQRNKYNIDWSVKHEKKKNCAQEKWIASRSTGKVFQVGSLNKINFHFNQLQLANVMWLDDLKIVENIYSSQCLLFQFCSQHGSHSYLKELVTSCRPIRSEIILVVNKSGSAEQSYNFVIIRMITDRIGLQTVLLPLLIKIFFPPRIVMLPGDQKEAIHSLDKKKKKNYQRGRNVGGKLR